MQYYTEPNLHYYSSYKEFLDPKQLEEISDLIDEKFTLKNLFSLGKCFLISEPGYGKTRLLKEIVIQADRHRKNAFFCDLKKLTNISKPAASIENFVRTSTESAAVLSEQLSEEELQAGRLFKSADFEFRNTTDTVICLDALDEVDQQAFSTIVDYIKEFITAFPDVQLFVSCREHHYKKQHRLFAEVTFKFVRIRAFSAEQSADYLRKHGLGEREVERIVEKLESDDTDSLIQVPRYLAILANLAVVEGAEDVLHLTKTQIFERFIYGKLEKEEKEAPPQCKEMVKRVLEKLALLMEIYQVNKISKEELITFFDDVRSNLTLSFLNQIPLQRFFERSLLKDDISSVEFENTEFQEYLAAKEILRLGRPDQIIFDLAVDPELREIYPSWFNVIAFAIDMNISLLKPILEFVSSKVGFLQDEEYHKLLTEVNVDNLPIEDRRKIFADILDYYQNVQHYMDHKIAKKLSNYFDNSHSALLKSTLDANQDEAALIIKRSNVAEVVTFLLEKDVLSPEERDYWKTRLLEFAKCKNAAGVLQREALRAISKFRDMELLKKVSDVFFAEDNELVQQVFLSSCIQINPNDDFAIKCFVEGLKKRDIFFARQGLWMIDSREGLKLLLDLFKQDKDFLIRFIDRESIHKPKDRLIIEHLKSAYDREIAEKLESFVLSALSIEELWVIEKSRFVREIIELLGENDPSYIFRLIAGMQELPRYDSMIWALPVLWSNLIRKEQVASFIKGLEDLSHGRRIAYQTLQIVNISGRKDNKEVYEEGRQYLQEEYEEAEMHWRDRDSQPSAEEQCYKEFQFKLEPEKGKYSSDVFEFYLENRECLSKCISSQDKDRLKKVVVESIFEKFEPRDHELHITSRGKDRTTYTIHPWIPVFGQCLQIAAEFNIDISGYRQKVIDYIPFAYDDDLKAIFALVPNLTSSEIVNLLEVYGGKRKDDLAVLHPSNLIEATNIYSLRSAIPILQEFVNREGISIHYRTCSLETISRIGADEGYFQGQFERHKETDTNILAVTANEILIERFQNEDAIRWRLEQLCKRAFPYVTPTGPHSISSYESELIDADFAKPIMRLKDPKYKYLLLALLDMSFDILQRGDEYYSYAAYLWGVVIGYFDNLKETRSYLHLQELEKHTQEIGNRQGINWFEGKLLELKSSYLLHIGKPVTFAYCINRYNQYKESQYLDVATPRDLLRTIEDVIKGDIKAWVESEGAYKNIQASERQEDLIQKTLKTQLENCLLRRGFRPSEVSFRREEQLLDGTRPDFLASYGFIGPILIEIKRVDNDEVLSETKRNEYRAKLLKYIKGTKSHHGIFLLFQTSKQHTLKDYAPKIRDVYKNDQNVTVLELDCTSCATT